ncbi:GerAB/ArcD/ProY family transporter [Priestia aryabhattai]|uniref:GerAB/ArcD/ProY family transporter n=1 Tax=Priestia aryabhattai TaxID=412384 RepID=UPI001C8EEE4B|nr:GerAB/ArcD/ProY family transporter [Priestia aryabhattai]HWL26427.1 GerAB/ArcD/ProY family transporter [Ureibacillus sp.]MBY0029081.1 GerAB/ArcD/ProY family transporter [Priestia aryabhattai]MBZ6488509.1 GerAB/ArcD/ProY family transporter [Priestia aryabhattai]MDH3111117.1 GerAB/ArcD/ProY family transporter [Priestia aryabhattai]MDH3129786.1 GerAB/ArcD/ProY family transporter [Priestia aryabhattai]
MEKAKISVIQLFALMFIFDLGTALIVSYGIPAGKDAWLAILLGMGGGIVLFFVYYTLFRQYPTLPLTGYIRKVFGKYLGWVLGLLYCLFFLYIAARNIRDFGDLLTSSTLPETPLLAINLSFILVMCYVIYLGIEVVGRTAEVFIVILLLFGLGGNFFILVSGDVDFHQIRPFLEHGWKPILTTAFPPIVSFPFGEMFVFMMLLPYLNRPKLIKRVWLSALISSGLILSWTAALNMSVLGLDVMQRSTFPTLATIGKVNLLDFIERLDAIVVFTLLMTVFFKASIFTYGAIIGITDLFKVKNRQQLILPIGFMLVFLSMTIASNFSEHLEEGFTITLKYLHVPFFIVLPLFMLVISIIRNYVKKKTS